jgi:hypothetical protein
MLIRAINKKYQSKINRFLSWDGKYNDLVNLDLEESRKGENAYDKANDLWLELPKREQNNIFKYVPELKGCYFDA